MIAGAAVLMAAGAAAQNSGVLPVEVVRRIDDPAAHGTWLLVRDPVHRAGPGRFLWAPRGGSPVIQPGLSADAVSAQPGEAFKPVILAGDRLVVEEETPLVDARLAATALNPAPAGAPLRVRLEIGGHVLRAIAIAPGRARLAPNPDIALEAAEP